MSQGKLCGKCSIAFNSAWRDAEARLTQPLKRIGPKGAGQFARLVHRRIQPNALTIARQGRSVDATAAQGLWPIAGETNVR